MIVKENGCTTDYGTCSKCHADIGPENNSPCVNRCKTCNDLATAEYNKNVKDDEPETDDGDED
jgi:hypothetical protein